VWNLKGDFGDLLTFGDILTNSLKRSLMLTVSHPYFKIRWLTNSGDKKIAEALFLASATFSVLNRWAKAHPLSHFAPQSNHLPKMGNFIARPGVCGEPEKKNVYKSY
jgi:hypothetical protein